jgi:hypothetical protein
MYGLTRATSTLIGVAAAGVLIWLASRVLDLHGGSYFADRTGRYWAAMALLAAAGLVMALSQLLGGWTKWGWPRVSGSVFLLGFLPALIAGGWILVAVGPHGWLARHVGNWSGDIGIRGLVRDLGGLYAAIAFGIGLVFGFTFDTSGPGAPRAPGVTAPPRRTAEPEPTAAPAPEAPPRAGEPTREGAATPPPR